MWLESYLSQLNNIYDIYLFIFNTNSSSLSAITLLQIDHVVFLFPCLFKIYINTAEGAV